MEKAARTFHFSSPLVVFFLSAMSTVNRMLNIPLSHSWKGKVTHTYTLHLSVPFSLSFMHARCVFVSMCTEKPQPWKTELWDQFIC